MLKPREELEKFLVKLFSDVEENSMRQEWYLKLEADYNIPITMSSDIITLRTDLSGYNEFVLFCITTVTAKNKVEKYFTQLEINTYSDQKLKDNKIKFPIKLKMFEVTNDQWIGASSAKFLMRLRDAQYINYNAETQRALEIMIRNGKEIYRPSVDYPSVKEITDAYHDNTFIPNTISLNIDPDDESADFDFDNDVLTIRSISHFDIFDGYHRYLGMGRNYDRDNSWDYPTELRITTFPVSKAKQFIWQEDHKTKMKKINQMTYDQRNAGNMICERLNNDLDFNFYGKINLSNGLINLGELSMAINKFYLDNSSVDRKQIIGLTRTIKQAINSFSEECERYLDKKWDRYETFIILYGLSKSKSAEEISEALQKVSLEDLHKLNSSQQLVRKQMNILEEVY